MSVARRYATCLAACAAITIIAMTSAMAINTDGRYKSPFDPLNDPEGLNLGISGAPWGAHRLGAGSGNCFSGGSTWQSSPVSYWGMNVDAGSYGMHFANRDQWPRMAIYNIPAGATYLRIVNNPDYMQGAFGYYANPSQSFAQKFQARGTSVTSVSCKFAAPTNAIAIIHQGDVTGPQIGPSRPLEGTYNNDSMACWSAGEVPTVPGQFYTVEFRKPDNSSLQLYYSRARCMMGEDFPGGVSWVGGVATPDPLRTIIGMDTDGITSTVNTSSANSKIAYDFIPTVSGQTFTAKGTSVLGVHFLAAAASGYEVAVFQSPGADGLGVNQIGPLKLVKANSDRSVGVWFPGEVPVTPGQSYYMRIRATSGGFALYHVTSDEYAGGTQYIGGLAKSYDMTVTILEETSPGSATAQPINFSGLPVVTRGATTATIFWNTNPASTTVLEYGSTLPYTHSVVDNNATTSHTVNLTNLTPATTYHARIKSSAAGRRDTYSRDFVFVTAPNSANLLSNPGFETGTTSGWTTYGNIPPPVKSSDIGGLAPRSGSYFLGGAYGSNPPPWAGAYQKINVAVSKPLTVQAWLYTYQLFGFNGEAERMVLGQIGVDVTGGTNPNAGWVKWSPLTSAQNWYANAFESRYQDMSLTVQPLVSQVTVFLRGGQPNLGGNPSSIPYVIYGWDDIYASQPMAMIALAKLGDIKGQADGTLVSIPNVIVTATTSQAGANYVEDQGRALGLRCEGGALFTRGHLVTVRGTLGTKPSGERYLSGATLLADVAASEAVSLGSKNGNLGKLTLDGAGPGNVGLLMRTWGRVQSVHTGYVMLNDGSSDGGIKINTASLGAAPPLNSLIEVIGIVQLEGTAPNGTLVVRPRDYADVVVLD